MNADDLRKMPSYQNATYGTPEPMATGRDLASRVRLIGSCPGCKRQEDGKWWRPCPIADCPSHGEQAIPGGA